MRRRDFIQLLGGATAAWSLAAHAQQAERMRRLALLTPYAASDPEGQARLAALREGLEKLGWAEGRNILIDNRWGALEVDSTRRFSKELVAQQPDLIFTQSTPTTAAMLQETHTIPILFVQVSDPVGQGFVASMARPGGNVTGFTNFEPALAGKWLELLKEIAPRVVGPPSYSTRKQRRLQEFTWTHSKPPLRHSEWRRSRHQCTTRPNSNPWLPHTHAR